MAERKKRGLGRGLGALIPDAASSDRPVDVFFSGGEPEEAKQSAEEPKAPRTARTDPAASMQSSRRRKPKAGASTGASTDKPAKKEMPAAKASPAKKDTGSAAVNSGGSESTAKKAAAGAKSTGAKTTGAKSASSKTTGAKTAGAKTTGANTAGTTKSDSAKASAAKSSNTKSTAVEPSAAKPAVERPSAKKAATEPSNDAPVETTPTKEPAKSKTVPDFGSVSPATAGDSIAVADNSATDSIAAPVNETAEPDVEANTNIVGGGPDAESVQTDDVSEMHPGVYRSGHEVFDEAQSATAGTSGTTDEVSTGFESGSSSSEPDVDVVAEDSAPGDDSSIAGVDSIPDTEFGEIEVDRIDANPRQPRTFFDEDQLSELVHSIREIGVLQPVVVRQKPGDAERFELIMGERRLRATKDAGLSTIPAIIRYVDDTDLLRDALLENLHRAELNPLEEAAAYGQLLEDFGCTQEELSERIGRSRPQISNTLRLLRLPPLVQRRVAAGVISAGHARAILGLREPEHMEVLAQRIVAEGMSVRASEEAVVLLNRGDSMNVSRATTQVSPQFIEVAERLGDRLDTKVNITVGKKKGKLSVEFANQDDLDRILTLLGVESPAE